MRLVTWNCQGGFHRKAQAIESLHPDLAIIQECECPDRLRSRASAWHARPIMRSADDPVFVRQEHVNECRRNMRFRSSRVWSKW